MTEGDFPFSFLEDARAVALSLEPVDPALVVEGSPMTGFAEWGSWQGMSVGVWEMSPGAMRDVEVDEVFIVVSGDALLRRVKDGLPQEKHLTPGVVCVLHHGEETEWQVRQSLRKVYLSPQTP